MPEGDMDVPTLGVMSLCGGGILAAAAFLFHKREIRLKQDLEFLRSMATTSVETACAEAQRQGKIFAQLSGESYTDEPLTSQDGVRAMAVHRRKLEKVEKYEWQEGKKIYETREVTAEDGRIQKKEVDTGRREPGHWIPEVVFREVENKTLLAPSGVCFRQLGASSSRFEALSPTSQICLNLGQFNVNQLLQCQAETRTFLPQDAPGVNVNVNVGSAERPPRPASRVLGFETRERILPMGQEVHALGDVAWRYRASIQGMQGGGGSLAVLQPAQVGPFTFAFGSRDDWLSKQQNSISAARESVMLCSGLGLCSVVVGGVVLLGSRSQ